MDTVTEGSSAIKKLLNLLSKERPRDTRYRLMRYTLKSDCDDGLLLYNVVTGQLVVLNAEEAELLNRLPGDFTEDMAELADEFYLVPEVYDEKNSMADWGNSAVVYPDGSLYKCEHVAEGDAYGSIFTGIADASKISKFEKTVSWDKCATCPLYPSCYILEECECKSGANEIACGFQVRSRTLAIADYYEKQAKRRNAG